MVQPVAGDDVDDDGEARRLVELVDAGQVEHSLRLQGRSWSDIATICGHQGAKQAQHARNRYLQRAALDQSKDARAEALQLEVDRLDSLQVTYWEAALAGDIKSAEFVLRVIGTRAKMLGLDVAVETTTGPRTVVVSGAPGDGQYVKTLKALIAGTSDGSEPEADE